MGYIGYDNKDVLGMKAADIGVALNSGSNLTKENSQMLISDNQLFCLLSSFKWGKNIKENI